jgi:mannose-1-phosphate guanylyltransferase
MPSKNLPECGVILAGGRGKRFWPRSRRRAPKQLINIIGSGTMLQQTVARLAPVLRQAQLWVVTNDDLAADVRKQTPGVPRAHILSEPVGRNTAAAIGLGAIHLRHLHGDAVMAVLPADHYIREPAKYRRLIRAALDVAASAGQIAVLGIQPTRPETGYGYIECVKRRGGRAVGALPVRRFTEKPSLRAAKGYVASHRHFWNAGMFFWRVSTFMEKLRWYLPQTHSALEEIAAAIGTPRYERTLRAIYPRLQDISVDYAILEPATEQTPEHGVSVIPAKCGWSDIGSWETVYELLSRGSGRGKFRENVAPGPHFALDARGNFLWSAGKFIAAIGVRDLAVVETPDALLICPRERAQDVGKVVEWLEAKKREDLL